MPTPTFDPKSLDPGDVEEFMDALEESLPALGLRGVLYCIAQQLDGWADNSAENRANTPPGFAIASTDYEAALRAESAKLSALIAEVTGSLFGSGVPRTQTMATPFQIGQRVKATSTAQGMIAGEIYEVIDAQAHETPFGSFATYKLKHPAAQTVHFVGNLHLLAEAVEEAAP